MNPRTPLLSIGAILLPIVVVMTFCVIFNVTASTFALCLVSAAAGGGLLALVARRLLQRRDIFRGGVFGVLLFTVGIPAALIVLDLSQHWAKGENGRKGQQKQKVPEISPEEAAGLFLADSKGNEWSPMPWLVESQHQLQPGQPVYTGLNLAGLPKGQPVLVKMIAPDEVTRLIDITGQIPRGGSAAWFHVRAASRDGDGFHVLQTDAGDTNLFVKATGAEPANLGFVHFVTKADPPEDRAMVRTVYLEESGDFDPDNTLVKWGTLGLPGYNLTGHLYVTLLRADGTAIPDEEIQNSRTNISLGSRVIPLMKSTWDTAITGEDVQELVIDRFLPYPLRLEVVMVVSNVTMASD